MRRMKSIKDVALLSIMLLLVSCTGDNTDLQNYINEVKQRTGRPIEPIPKMAPLPIFKYPENDTRRSPFKPVDLRKRTDQAPDQNRKKQPLEFFPLDALKFVGTLKQGTDVWALIRQPNKQVTRVRVGDYMGQNYGHVISINDEAIKLEETIKDSGAWEKKMTTLNLDTGKE